MTSKTMKTVDARRHNLPGSDVYRYSHHVYHDDLSRDHAVVRLNIESLKAFYDTITISRKHEFEKEAAESQAWFAAGGSSSGIPFPTGNTAFAFLEYLNYEYLKIASAFELHLKGRLLSVGIVIHEIDRRHPGCETISKIQKKSPITKQELFLHDEYHFDGKLNFLPSLTDKSLNFQTIIQEKDYRSKLNLNARQLGIINEYRILRNQIHFPGDTADSPLIDAESQPMYAFLIEYINQEIIRPSNLLINKYKMNRGELRELV